jgi:hypothetical protein
MLTNLHKTYILVILVIASMAGCKKDDEIVNRERILGTWISEDKNDSLNFTDNTNFYKNGDHFDYTLYKDSIEVAYSGVLYIYVLPTKHKYLLTGDNLTIDFSNRSCFGFDREVEHFIRK